MKKQIITTAILLGLGIGGFAQGGGLFQKGTEPDMQRGSRDVTSPMMPNQHGSNGDFNGNGDPTSPVGNGIAVLTTLGAAYLVAKKRKED